jgi:hypothetical protein
MRIAPSAVQVKLYVNRMSAATAQVYSSRSDERINGG